MITVKFPSGEVGSELLHYMGADDELHYNQRPPLAKKLIDKCFIGKQVELSEEEKQQLISEVENAVDIKQDHVGDGNWNGLQQYSLSKFLTKLKSL
jgi:hypothetical protein